MNKPNWKKEEEYPEKKGVSMHRWAWEFLRRNQEYRENWEHCVNTAKSIVPGFDPTDPGEALDQLESDERFYVYDPAKKLGESDAEWVQRVEKGTRSDIFQWHGKKWGLRSWITDPEQGYCDFELNGTAVSLAGPGWDGFSEAPRTKAACIIDFNLPLEGQLAALSKWAKQRHETLIEKGDVTNWKEKRGQDYRLYLRILDALEEKGGADQSEKVKFIGENFYRDKDNEYPGFLRDKSARAAIKTAISLRDEGYRWLPLKAAPKEVKK